jgi:hypothetical protein
MMRYAAVVGDLAALWSTKIGSALVLAAVHPAAESAETVKIAGADAVVLCGAKRMVHALAAALAAAELPGAARARARVYAETARGWQQVRPAPRAAHPRAACRGGRRSRGGGVRGGLIAPDRRAPHFRTRAGFRASDPGVNRG